MPSQEFELIRQIAKNLGKPSSKTLVGIGDDAAVVKVPSGKMVLTADSMVENIHFDLGYTTPRELGHKALSVNLSDIAAMGATPLFALVSIGLRQETSDEFVGELYAGIRALAKRFHVDVVGGNTSHSPTSLFLDITLVGETPSPILRSGARKGDLLAVTGNLGASASGLTCLKRLGRPEAEERRDLLEAHLRPEPRIAAALALRRLKTVTSAIDISDGLASEVHHLAESSGVGIIVDEELIPVTASTKKMAETLNSDSRAWALYGGEDYELLVTLKPESWKKSQAAVKKAGTRLTLIGSVVGKENGVTLRTLEGEESRLEARGWHHFVRRHRR